MKKILITTCSLACLVGFLTAMLGCDQSSNEPVTPKIVRKKIRTNTDRKPDPPQQKPARASLPTPKPVPPSPGKQSPEKPVLAKKTTPPAIKPPETNAQKPKLKPKSDISKIQTPSFGQPAPATAGPATVADTSAANRPIYNPKGKVNPFEPLFREKPALAQAKSKRKKRVPRTPLEKIDLSQLKLVGIITASSGNKALVEESNGKGYVIRTGTYIGTNAGKVVKIQNNKVIVAEEYEDVVGNVTVRNKELKLPKPPGEF